MYASDLHLTIRIRLQNVIYEQVDKNVIYWPSILIEWLLIRLEPWV